MHRVSSSDWAEGLYLTVTGLSKDERQHVREVVETAGGRYSPNFSKRCTHLLVSADPSDANLLKVYLAGINKDKWQSRAVRMDWLLECANQHKIVAEAPFTVEAPAYEDLSLPHQRLQQIAIPTLSAAGTGSIPHGSDSSASISKRSCVAIEGMQNITTRSGSRHSSKRHKQSITGTEHLKCDQASNSDISAAPAQSAASMLQQEPAHITQLSWQSRQKEADNRTDDQARWHMLHAQMQQAAALPCEDVTMQDAQSISSDSGVTHQSAVASIAGRNFFPCLGSRKVADAARALPKADIQTAHKHVAGVATSGSLASQLHEMHADAQLKPRFWPNSSGSARYDASLTQTAACAKGEQAPSVSALAYGSAQVQLPKANVSKTQAGHCAATSAEATGTAMTAQASNAVSKASPHKQGANATDHWVAGDLTAETESLVAKLRALSQGRSDSAAFQMARPGRSQPATLSSKRQLANTAKPALPTGPDSKRPKQCETTSISSSASRMSANSGPAQQQRPTAARHIELAAPVHSSMHLRQAHSSVSQSQQLKSPRSSPSRTNHSRHASVGAPIHLQPQPASRTAPAIVAATAAEAQAPPAVTVPQEDSSAPQARLGKATPLKKIFTPKPSRFRLEAERRSVTPPDKCTGAAKVLFGSPEKQTRQLDALQESVSAAGTATAPQPDMEIAAEIASQPAVANASDSKPMQASDQVQAARHAMPEPRDAQAAQQMDTEMPLTMFGATSDACASANVYHASAASQLAVTPANQPCAPKGVFFGMKVILDPELSCEESVRMSKAVQAGGGEVVGSAHLGGGATHVVCQPEAAVKWLAMGLSIVSPPWLLRSLAQGTPDRCLHMSLDASRHLPPSALSRPAASSHSKSSSAQHNSAVPEFADRQVRQALVQQLQMQGPQLHWGAAQQALQTPQSMLEEVLWSLSDPPEQARLDSMLATSAAPCNQQPPADDYTAMVDCSSMLSASQEACQAELAMVEAECSVSAGTVQECSLSLSRQPGNAFQTADWQEIFYQAPALTLLLPLDSSGACGYCTRSLQIPPKGCSRQLLMHTIYNFYQEELDVREQLKLMQVSSSAADAVKEVFLEGAAVKRIALMHAKVNLDGLERVSRNLTGTIYEVQLSC